MNTWIWIYKITQFSNLKCKRCFFKWLLHLPWSEMTKITTGLSGATFTVLLCQLSKILPVYNSLSYLWHLLNCLIFCSLDCFTSSSNDWVSWSSMFQQDMATSNRSLEIQKLNLKLQSCIWWNNSTSTSGAISVIWWACKCCFASFFELTYSFIPTFNNLSYSNLKFKWSSFLDRRIKDGSIH